MVCTYEVQTTYTNGYQVVKSSIKFAFANIIFSCNPNEKISA